MKSRGKEGGEKEKQRGREGGQKKERDGVRVFFLILKTLRVAQDILFFQQFSQKVPEIYFTGEKLGTSSV